MFSLCILKATLDLFVIRDLFGDIFSYTNIDDTGHI